LEGAVSVPLLEAIEAGGPGPKVGGELSPGSAGVEYPQDSFEELVFIGVSGQEEISGSMRDRCGEVNFTTLRASCRTYICKQTLRISLSRKGLFR